MPAKISKQSIMVSVPWWSLFDINILHNSTGVFCVWGKTLSNDFSTESWHSLFKSCRQNAVLTTSQNISSWSSFTLAFLCVASCSSPTAKYWWVSIPQIRPVITSRCIRLCLHNTGRLLRRQKWKLYRIGLVFTSKKRSFCNGMKLRRADLESEASYIG